MPMDVGPLLKSINFDTKKQIAQNNRESIICLVSVRPPVAYLSGTNGHYYYHDPYHHHHHHHHHHYYHYRQHHHRYHYYHHPVPEPADSTAMPESFAGDGSGS